MILKISVQAPKVSAILKTLDISAGSATCLTFSAVDGAFFSRKAGALEEGPPLKPNGRPASET